MRTSQRGLRCLLLVAGVLFSLTTLARERMEVIPLRHASAEQLLPALRPILPPEARVSGYRNQIIIHADGDIIAELVKVITSLDRSPRRLMLHISQGETLAQQDRGWSASTRILVGDGEVVLGQPPSGNGTHIRLGQGRSNRSSNSSQSIQTVEGQPALIRSGLQLPLVEHYEDGSGRSYSRVIQQDATRGVYAVARLLGNDEVQIELYSQNNRPGPGGTLDVQQAETTLRGRVGDWLDFAGVQNQSEETRKDLTAKVSSDEQSGFGFRVRVEVLDP